MLQEQLEFVSRGWPKLLQQKPRTGESGRFFLSLLTPAYRF